LLISHYDINLIAGLMLLESRKKTAACKYVKTFMPVNVNEQLNVQ